MAEIRVRDASPQLMKQLEEIALELKEATITGCLMRLIPRYHDMKKRIVECNNEISALTRDLRTAQNRVATAGTDLTDYLLTVRAFHKETGQQLKGIEKQTTSFLSGTKKRRAPGRPAPRKGKKVPSPKKKK